MKKIILFSFITLILWQCQLPKIKHYNTLKGTYKINIDSALNYLKQDSEYTFLINQFGGLISNSKILIVFENDSTGHIEANSNYLPIIQNIIDSSIDQSNTFFYKIVQDTLLLVKWTEKDNYHKWAYI